MGSRAYLLMLCTAACYCTAISMDCAEGSDIEGILTLLWREGEELLFANIRLPDTTLTDVSPAPFTGANLTVSLVSELHHERTVTNPNWTANLLDGGVVLVLNGATDLLHIEQCLPHQLFQHSSNVSFFLLCANMSKIMKVEQSQEGFVLNTKDVVQAKEGQKYLNVSAVPLYSPEYQTTAAFIHFGLTDDEVYNKTWLTIVTNLEDGANIHTDICDDTYYETGNDESCTTEYTSIAPFNDTHFLLECRESASSDKKRFLVDAFSTGNCEGIIKPPVSLNGGDVFVGPDKDTLAINQGNTVTVFTNDFTKSYNCIANELIMRVDFVATASNGLTLLLFTSSRILTCSHLGKVNLLSPFPLLDTAFPYYIDGYHLFLAQKVGTSDSYQISLFDVQKGCQVQFPSAGPISPPNSPVLFVFAPEALKPTSTSLAITSQPTVDTVMTTTKDTSVVPFTAPSSPQATESVSSDIFTSNGVVIALSAVVVCLLIFSAIVIVISCVMCNSGHKSRTFSGGSEECHTESVNSASSGSTVPSIDVLPIQETHRSPLCIRRPVQVEDV